MPSVLQSARELYEKLGKGARQNLGAWKQVATTPKLRQEYGRLVVKPAVKKAVAPVARGVTRGLAGVQRATQRWESTPRVQLPRFKAKTPVGGFFKNLPVGIAESYVNIPRNVLVSSTRLGSLAGEAIRGKATNVPTRLISGIAPIGESLLDVYVPKTVGGLAQKTGKQLIKKGFKTGLRQGAIEGGLGGIAYELGKEPRDIDWKRVLQSGGIGTVLGGVFGGFIGGTSATFGQLKKIIAKNIQKIRPKLSTKQAEKEAVRYIQLETGRMAGSKPKYKSVDDVKFVGDLRESLGLSRYGDEIPQIGQSIRDLTKKEHLARGIKEAKVDLTGKKLQIQQPPSIPTLKAKVSGEAPGRVTLPDIIPEEKISIKPPTARGGIQPPELNFTKWKDKPQGILGGGRETMIRNIEDVAGKDAGKVKEFLITPLRKNDTKLAEWETSLRKEVEKKVRGWHIREGSNDDALVQAFGEKRISLPELKKQTENWRNVVKASDYFRQLYDNIIDAINKQRVAFGYEPIPKLTNYFRHFQDIGFASNMFGILGRKQDLPTEIAGITHIFSPGKPFTTAQLHRKGGPYTESAIGGINNYISSVGRQMFHIDSVQRGRALEKYIRQAGEQEAANLPSFVSNLHNWTNLVSGKKARFDRAFEDVGGRNIYKAANALRSRTGANMVGGNISSALTNFIPLTQAAATTEKRSFIKGLMESLSSPVAKNFNEIDGVKSSFLTRRFRKESIDPRGLRNVKEKAGWLFKAVDKFTAKTITAGKYFENLAKGMNPAKAMKQADDYAIRVLGERSIGELPNLINTKALGFITQFQMEVNNQASFLAKDIPKIAKGNVAKAASMLAQIAIYSHLFNSIYEKVTGRRPAIDPIQYGKMMAGLTPETEGEDLAGRLTATGGEMLENVPFIGSRLPVTAALPDIPGAIAGETTWKKELAKPLFYVAPPFGGSQIRKTLSGLKTVKEGVSTTPTGRIRFKVKRNLPTALKAAIFGQWSLPEARAYVKTLGKSKSEIEYKRLSKLSPAEARAEALKIKKSNPSLFTQIKKRAKDEQLGTTKREKQVRTLPINDGSRVRMVVRELKKKKTDAEKRALILDWKAKGIITDSVMKQLREMAARGLL